MVTYFVGKRRLESEALAYTSGDSMIFVKIFLTCIFTKKAPKCSRGSTVYQKNQNNFVWGFKMGGDRQK